MVAPGYPTFHALLTMTGRGKRASLAGQQRNLATLASGLSGRKGGASVVTRPTRPAKLFLHRRCNNGETPVLLILRSTDNH